MRQHQVDAVAFPFLVGPDVGQQLAEVRRTFGWETQVLDRAANPFGRFGSQESLACGGLADDHVADRHRLAVGEGRNALLHCMGKGVTEIQLAPLAVFPLVMFDDGHLDADRTDDDFAQQRLVVADLLERVALGQCKELRIADDGRLDHFGQSGAEIPVGETAQQIGVAEHEFGLVERTDDILVAIQIDAVLAADAGIDLGQQGGGQEAEADAAHVGRGDEAGDVRHDAAAHAHQKGAAVGSHGQQLAVDLFDLDKRLAAFALADHISFMVQRARKHLRVKMPLAYDIQTLYPQEYKIARYTLERAQKEFKIGLDKQEIVGIALNFVNSRITPDSTETTDRTLQDETMLEDLIEIVEEHFGLIVERTGFNYTRYASHMQYLFDRIHAGTLIQSGNSPIYQDLKRNHPKVADCVEKIAAHLEQEWSCHLSDEEKLYIMLHVNRVCSKSQT